MGLIKYLKIIFGILLIGIILFSNGGCIEKPAETEKKEITPSSEAQVIAETIEDCEILPTTFEKEMCYKTKAIQEKDSSICKGITNEAEKQKCINWAEAAEKA